MGSSVENGYQKSPQKEKLINDMTKIKSIYGLSKTKSNKLFNKII